LTPRSWYSAGSRRRKKFSAATDRRHSTTTQRGRPSRRAAEGQFKPKRSRHRSVKVPPWRQLVPDSAPAEQRTRPRRATCQSRNGIVTRASPG
jgi:hypothetical protein